MSDAIDTTDGVSSAVFAREDAWHRLGTTLPDTFTAEEAMRVGHLGGWNVRKIDLTATDPLTGETIIVPDRRATVRTNPVNGKTNYLGTVGTVYKPIQNEEHCELLNALVDESGARFETAGALHEGREVFVTMKLPETMTIGQSDELDLYIAALNTHDGSKAFRLMVTPVRIVCANTQAMALHNNHGIFSIKHVGSAQRALAQARESLALTWKALEGFQAEAEKMIQESLSEAEFHEIITREFGPAEQATTRALNRWEQEEAQLLQIWNDFDTNSDIRDTRWGGYQATVEYLDHFAPARGGAAVRANRVLFGLDAARKAAAMKAFAVA